MPMTAFEEMSRWRASLFLVAEPEEPVEVLLAEPGLLSLLSHVNWPLITLLEPDSALKVLQSALMSLELWRLKAPRQSEREGRVTLNHG